MNEGGDLQLAVTLLAEVGLQGSLTAGQLLLGPLGYGHPPPLLHPTHPNLLSICVMLWPNKLVLGFMGLTSFYAVWKQVVACILKHDVCLKSMVSNCSQAQLFVVVLCAENL